MKSLTAVCQTGASMPAINPNGRISRHPHHRGDGESAEMKMYLSKLKDLVPFMPKNRKLSKLEIIQHVIDYICDLQSELETHPEISNFDAAAALNFTTNLDRVPSGNDRDDDDNEDDNEEDEIIYDDVQERLNGISQQQEQQQQQQQQQHQSSPTQRQPLVDRQTPNTILPATHQTTTNHQQVMVSAVNNTSVTQTNTSTYSAANNTNNTSNTTVSSSSSTTTTTTVTTNLSHTLSNEKPVDNSSRQFC